MSDININDNFLFISHVESRILIFVIAFDVYPNKLFIQQRITHKLFIISGWPDWISDLGTKPWKIKQLATYRNYKFNFFDNPMNHKKE